MKIDILMYADDVVLMTSCLKEAQLMLDELTIISETHQIKLKHNEQVETDLLKIKRGKKLLLFR